MLPELVRIETDLMFRELQQEIEDRFQAGEQNTGEVLMAIYAVSVPGQTERTPAVPDGPDQETNRKKQ